MPGARDTPPLFLDKQGSVRHPFHIVKPYGVIPVKKGSSLSKMSLSDKTIGSYGFRCGLQSVPHKLQHPVDHRVNRHSGRVHEDGITGPRQR